MRVEPLPDATAIIAKLSDFDKDVLRTACGDDRMTGWGAAVTEAAEYLQDLGLLRRDQLYKPTPLGASIAKRLANANQESNRE